MFDAQERPGGAFGHVARCRLDELLTAQASWQSESERNPLLGVVRGLQELLYFVFVEPNFPAVVVILVFHLHRRVALFERCDGIPRTFPLSGSVRG